jgi:branched-chain amino acid transport system ATP-binding protein
MMSQPAVLRADGLHAGYGQMKVLHSVSLCVEPGELVALIGPNAAGKTTLLRCISGFVKQSAGTLELDGAAMASQTAQRIRLGMGYVPEGGRAFADLTVRENLALGGYLLSGKSELEASRDWVVSVFPVLGARMSQLAGTLSGGERQMLAIGRCLMLRPKILLLDEPSVGLAPRMAELLLETLRRLSESDGIAMLIVEQRLRSIFSIASRAYVLARGRIAGEIDNPNPDEIPLDLNEIFLGTAGGEAHSG